jgi:hypothetical protein
MHQGGQGGAQMQSPGASGSHGGSAGSMTSPGALSGTTGSGVSDDSKAPGAANEKMENRGKAAQTPLRGEKAGTTGQNIRENDHMKSSRDNERSKSTTGQGSSESTKSGRDEMRNRSDKSDMKSRSETKSSTTTGQGAASSRGAANLSTEQRTKITTTIRSHKTEYHPVEHVKFSISIGTRVPRSGVTLYTLPATVVEVYPAWRGYKFILVGDQIVVIDPGTYEIVAVLEA